MNANDAFGSLMRRNALNIPVATPSPEARRSTRRRRKSPTDALRTPGALDGAAAVLDIFKKEPRDYNPLGAPVEDEEGVFNRPTETDLDAVEEGERLQEMKNARVHGARIIGRDVSLDGFVDPEGEAPVAEHYAPPCNDAGLDRARRLRRFAYLPLADMDEFENIARDLMARMHSHEPERPSLALTSSRRGEGQTELLIRLGLAMAKRVDYRVLLADFDVRHPQLAGRLGLSSKYFTLSDVLRGSCLLGEALQYSEEDNLYVLPARASDRDGDEFLDGGQVQRLMQQMHRTFDFTVIGCGPIDHADALTTCREAGFTALAGFCGFSRAGMVYDAAEKLASVGARVAGMLLTGG